VHWILLVRRFGKVISILMGTFIPPQGRCLALASLTGLPVRCYQNEQISYLLLSNKSLANFKRKRALVITLNFNPLDIQNNLAHASQVIRAKKRSKSYQARTRSRVELNNWLKIDRKETACHQMTVNSSWRSMVINCNRWQSIAIRGLKLVIIDWSSIGR